MRGRRLSKPGPSVTAPALPGVLLFCCCATAAGARSLGVQEVRIGPIVPEISLWWVIAIGVVGLFFGRVPRSHRVGILGSGLVLTALASALPAWLGVVSGVPPPKALSVYDLSRAGAGPDRETSIDFLRVVDRGHLNHVAGRRARVELDISGHVMVPRSGSHRFEARCDDHCSLEIDNTTVLSGRGALSAEVDLGAGPHRFRLRYEQHRGPAGLEVRWDRPGRIDLLPLHHYVSHQLGFLTSEALRSRTLASVLTVFSSTLFWLGAFCIALWAGEKTRSRHGLRLGGELVEAGVRALVVAVDSRGRLEGAEPNLQRDARARAKVILMMAALNLPFVLFHPDWPLVELRLLRSLAVNGVLFLVPGVPIAVALLGHRKTGVWLPWGLTFSLGIFIAVVSLFFVTGTSLTSGGAWNATWIVTNVGLLGAAFSHRLGACSLTIDRRAFAVGGPLFVGAYVLFFFSAANVVPPQSDHDFEVQATGYGLLTRLEPLLLTDRRTFYYFAHPLLLHGYVAGSFLYFDNLNHLAYYDRASKRAFAAERGDSFEPPTTLGHRRVIGTEGSDYVVDPPLENGNVRVSVMSSELRGIYRHYANAPHKIATRAPSIFLAAVTVSLLGVWVRRIAPGWLAFLVGMAYATSPEVYVRSSYGGYYAISNFSLILNLIAMERFSSRRDTYSFATCFLTGCLAALANHKLVLLPIAIMFWLIFRTPKLWRRNLFRAPLHPVVLGFTFGTALFWAYGMAVDFDSFWLEHVRTHLADRLIHHNPLGYGGYPGPLELWVELWKHTGYLLLPLGFLTLIQGARGDLERGKADSLMGLFLYWSVITAIVFTSVDWRMTKHLTPLMLPLHLAPVLWASGRRPRFYLVGLAFTLIVVWNWTTIHALSVDFDAFRVSPDW